MTAFVTKEAPGFPLTWDEPADADYMYTADRMHFPRPLSPLFADLIKPMFEDGFMRAARELNIPIRDVKVSVQNGYLFTSFVPVIPGTDEEARSVAERAEATMKMEIGRMMKRWEQEHLPQIKSYSSKLSALNPTSAERSVVVTMLDEVMRLWTGATGVHFRIVMPMLLAMQAYDDLYLDIFGGDEQDAHALLTGALSMSVKAGIGLSKLAEAARLTGLNQDLLAMDPGTAMTELESLEMGRYFAAAVRDYLREFGLRQDLFELTTPTWQEDPSIAIAMIQGYLRSGHDAISSHDTAVALAGQALDRARTLLTGYPEAVRSAFEAMVQFARDAYFLQEEHNFYIDQQMLSLARLFFLMVGNRLVDEGALDEGEQIFMLTLDEVRALFASDEGIPLPEVRNLIAARASELADAALLTPPPFIGSASDAPPADDPMTRAMMRFFGGPPQEAAQANQLKGSPGSRGTARGIARVVDTLDEAKALLPGEILVTITTMPAWTPLFGTAAAIVTETGGALSHCAIVAREYGIPAVVGVFGATRLLHTGQLITVDGASGLVTIEE